MSKAYGLPGLRIGWLATRAAGVLGRAERAKQYLSICNANTSETLAAVALDKRDAILDAVRLRARRNLARLDAVLATHSDRFDWVPPRAGVLAYPRYKGREGAAAFAARLVQQTGILVVPSIVYRSTFAGVPGDRLRIGFGRRTFDEAVDRLGAWLLDRHET